MNPVGNKGCGETGCLGYCVLTEPGGKTGEKVCRCCRATFHTPSRAVVKFPENGQPLCCGTPGQLNLRVLEPRNEGRVSILGLALLCLALAMPCMIHHH